MRCEVWFQSECNDTTPVTFNLYVTYNGKEVVHRHGASAAERALSDQLHDYGGRAGAIPSDGGIITGVDSLDYQAKLEGAAVIQPGEPRNGSITQDNKFDLYVFTGRRASHTTSP